MVPLECSRRSVIRTAGTGLGILMFASGTGSAGGDSNDVDSAVEWVRSYGGADREYEFTPRTVQQTTDHGYVIAGEGAPVTETGPEETQFGCLKTDDAGEVEWLSFAGADHETELNVATDVIERRDGSLTVIGNGEYDEGEAESDEWWYEPVARAGSFSSEGETEWVTAFDQFADDDSAVGVEESPRLASLALPVSGDGVVAVGELGGDGWIVAFAADGSVEWQQTYEGVLRLGSAFTGDDGYRLHGIDEDRNVILHVDSSGSVEREVVLDIDYASIPHNHVVTPVDDGGFAITGRYQGRQRMVLQRFDESGAAAWLETYNGPYDGIDWAYDVVETDDGGFALFGRMEAAYTGDTAPAIVKTDSAGNEEWQSVLDSVGKTGFRLGMQTAEGGLAGFIPGSNNALVKFASLSTGAEEEPVGEPDESDEADDPGNESATGTNTSVNDENESADNNGEGAGNNTQHGNSTAGAQPDDDSPGVGLVAALGSLGGALGYLGVRQRGGSKDRP